MPMMALGTAFGHTDESDGPDLTPSNSLESQMSTLTLSQYRQAIIDGYEGDTQFSKALKTGVESGIYQIKDGLLYLAFSGFDQ